MSAPDKDKDKTISFIPAGQPFARLLAENLLKTHQGREDSLSETLILLPTRRACRVLQESFLSLRGHKPMILPRMQPVGDLDEEELSLSITGQTGQDHAWSLPAALPPMQRQILLAKLIRQIHTGGPHGITHERTLMLAQALGALMDHIYTENLNLADLANLVPEDFAEHWQITLKFLEILSEHWPKILAEHGVIDQADRRNRLILALAKFWQSHSPNTPIIGAGSTGSIPATARLLSVIAELPNGQIILPGFDPDLDDQSWNALSESHPQFGFKQLLGRMKVPREIVKPFTNILDDSHNHARQALARELMRPGETAQRWTTIKDNAPLRTLLKQSLDSLSRIACEHPREEAETIAILMRETLETPDKTACLITPDRTLAARVVNVCQRWDITIDDSAGQSLRHSAHGTFVHAALQTIIDGFSPVTLLALLKHAFCELNLEPETRNQQIQALDYALRGHKPAPGFEGLRTHVASNTDIDESAQSQALSLLSTLEPLFKSFSADQSHTATLPEWLKAHLQLCETLAASQTDQTPSPLWHGETGRHASRFFSQLFEQTTNFDPLDLQDYQDVLSYFMDQVQIRPAFGTHPRLQILGTLEARLIEADLVILGGLNEGTWPPDPAADPWMSRPMRKDFGLPAPERSIGLAAHDFVQGLCTPNVVLTRAARTESGPAVPSRWLQRLSAVIQAAGLKQPQSPTALHWARMIDHAQTVTPIATPAPCPPIETRPQKLSVTKIETWLRDPYAIYARYILGLTQLDPLEKPLDAATRGNILHKICERFVTQTRSKPLDNAASDLLQIAKDEVKQGPGDPDLWSFWWPRFTRIAHWLQTHEQTWRDSGARNIATECRGELTVDAAGAPFTLVAIADRIDQMGTNTAAIIDYKSGGTYPLKSMQNGQLPQLPLEALILSQGRFAGIGAQKIGSLQYWVLNGSEQGGKVTALNGDLEALINQTLENLKQLIESYNDPKMPYLCQPRPDHIPRFNDYEHLERVREWATINDDTSTEAA